MHRCFAVPKLIKLISGTSVSWLLPCLVGGNVEYAVYELLEFPLSIDDNIGSFFCNY